MKPSSGERESRRIVWRRDDWGLYAALEDLASLLSEYWAHKAIDKVIICEWYIAVVFSLSCPRTPIFNFTSNLYPQSYWRMIEVIHRV
jgi:hypothetical protein